MENHTNKRPVKIGGYSQRVANAKREKRQVQADARQARYDALSNSQKIERAQSRRGESRRELTRLGAL